MALKLSEINARIRADKAGFLAECDAALDEKVRGAAERILQNLRRSPIILLAGPSGSGKTTSARKLEAELRRRGVQTHAVSLDDYYLDQDPARMPRTARGDVDYESPEILDLPLLGAQFAALRAGEEILVPRFDFVSQLRDRTAGIPLRLGRDEAVVFEGIHALNPKLAGQQDEAFRLYISARSNVMDGQTVRFKGTWMRLARRAVRDCQSRGKSVAVTLNMWESVRDGEKAYISPYKNSAHVLLDSALPYEVSVMRAYAAEIGGAVADGIPRQAEMAALVRAFDAFEPVEEELVAPDSLLREFVGGLVL